VAPLLDRLVEELENNKKVLWLIPGGSNIPLSVEVMRQIPEDLTSNLTVYLTDERYGEFNHPDSNSRQLEEAGFEHKNARVTWMLAEGLSLEETAEQYALSMSTAFDAADVVIAQMGMGADGHICGILPGSPAVDSDKLVVGYVTENFTRITLTPKALMDHISVAYVFAFGEAKKEALANLFTDIPLNEQPAQVLKSLPETYVYNDQIEGEV
jgi:6-phosphogluconolactonase/glucosamine-6-phosphate isomerase/deaminase